MFTLGKSVFPVKGPHLILTSAPVQGLVTKGWVELFAKWWQAWVNKTGVVGAVGGMGFLSVVMCNVSSRAGISRFMRRLEFI